MTSYCARLMGHQIGQTSIFVTSMFQKLALKYHLWNCSLSCRVLFHINLALASKPCWQTHEILLFCRTASEEMNHIRGMKNIFVSYPRKETKLGCLGNSQEWKSYIFCNVYKAKLYCFWTANPFLLDSSGFVEPICEYIREAFVTEISD